MATNYNDDQTGTRSGLDEPRRTTESTGFDQSRGGDSGYGGQGGQGVDSGYGGQGGGTGYGGVSENEPPHHRIHTDDEPLPKPTGGTNDDELFSTPSATGTGGNYGDDDTEKFQDSRSGDPQTGSYDDTPQTGTTGLSGQDKPSGGYSDPSSAFPGAPVDRSVQQPGYGQGTQASDPTSTGAGATDPTGTGTGLDSPTPKKEGFVQKLKDKLPGHKTSTPDTVDDDTPVDAGTPKKGLITKIKEKLPGHHSPTAPTTE